MWNFIFITTLAVAASPVQVETLDGKKLAGEIQTWNDAELVLTTKNETESIPAAKLAMVRPLSNSLEELPTATVFLDLVDGSTLEATTYTVSKGTAAITLRDGQLLNLPMQQVAAVRLKNFDSPDLAKQWEQIRQSKPGGDLVVVRKGEALDFLEGVLGDVTADNVTFKLDGDDISVKRIKLEGMIFFQNEAPRLAELACIVSTQSGLSLQAKNVSWKGGEAPKLAVTTLAGAEVMLPWNDVTQVNFAAGRMTYLSELTPESVSYAPYFPLSDKLPLLAKYGQPVFDRSFEGGPLRFIPEAGSDAAPAEYSRGIALRSHTELVYRLTDKYRRFRGLAFIDARMRGNGNVKLSIFGDDKPLLEEEVSGRVAPLEIDVDVTGVKRIKIVVGYGADSDVADHLDLAEARVTK